MHAREHRKAGCIAVGNGGTLTTLDVNLVAAPGASDNCGVLVNNVSAFLCLSLFAVVQGARGDEAHYVICLTGCG